MPHNRILDRDITRLGSLAVPVDGKVLIQSPSYRQMVEDHILSVGYAGGIFPGRTFVFAHVDAQIANDQVAGSRKGDTVSMDDNAIARCCLSCYVGITTEDEA